MAPPTDANIERAPRKKLNILLSNGRFPVSLDLARQLHKTGHSVFVVDPMHFHVCKFSFDVRRSWQTPAPSRNRDGYLEVVKKVIRKANIDLIVPVHEEILYLAGSGDPEITQRLLAPSFSQLYQLHSKWEFFNTLKHYKLDVAETHLCTSRGDVEQLDRTRDWALKPVLGRSSSGVYHLKPGQELDWSTIEISHQNPYVAQGWINGSRYCTYSIFRNGHLQAFGVYPVLETIDGSSSVYFEAVEHKEIREYMIKLASVLKFTGQMALDFIEERPDEIRDKRPPEGKGGDRTPVEPITSSSGNTSPSKASHRLIAIECNPRATSGVHLWSGTPRLGLAFQDKDCTLPEVSAQPGFAIQTAPGMLMWKHERTSARRYVRHLTRLLCTRDVIWSLRDFGPVLMQPFLLASYYQICYNMGGISLAEMFQDDLIWSLESLKLSEDRQNAEQN